MWATSTSSCTTTARPDPGLIPAQIHSFDVCNTDSTDVQTRVHQT